VGYCSKDDISLRPQILHEKLSLSEGYFFDSSTPNNSHQLSFESEIQKHLSQSRKKGKTLEIKRSDPWKLQFRSCMLILVITLVMSMYQTILLALQ
jgi:hypothetical protein